MRPHMADDNRPSAPITDATIERLRDRTDELELIISSLTMFALLSFPGWLFAKVAGFYTHFSTTVAIASTMGTTLLAGVSYGLAACFIVHLMARAYWVGLIGLRTVFPNGINWDRTPGLGPISRRYYRDTLPDLDTVIQKTDRVASSLFAVISMLTLTILWLGAILVVTLAIAGVIGARFGQTNAAIGIGSLALLGIFLGAPFLLYALDKQLASRKPTLSEHRLFAGVIRLLRRISDLAYPRRLVLPVQLTLQTNMRPFVFYLALSATTFAIVFVGNLRASAWQNFTLSGEFSYLDGGDVTSGFMSTFYEDMPDELDRLRAWPRVDSFYQSRSFVRLFLPYQPLRDNLILDQFCDREYDTEAKVACLRKLWQVSIDGTEVPMAEFESAERADLDMRGLIGLVPLAGVEPGLRRIEVLWNPNEIGGTARLDDRYDEATFRYVIPIAFSPGYEMSLPAESTQTDSAEHQ